MWQYDDVFDGVRQTGVALSRTGLIARSDGGTDGRLSEHGHR